MQKKMLEEIDRLNPNDVIFNLLAFNSLKAWDICKRISDRNIYCRTLRLGGMPTPEEDRAFLFRVKKVFNNPALVPKFLFTKFLARWFPLRPFKFLLRGGNPILSSWIS